MERDKSPVRKRPRKLKYDWLQRYFILGLDVPQVIVSSVIFHTVMPQINPRLVNKAIDWYLDGYSWDYTGENRDKDYMIFEKNGKKFRWNPEETYSKCISVWFAHSEKHWYYVENHYCQKIEGEFGISYKTYQITPREILLDAINFLRSYRLIFEACRVGQTEITDGNHAKERSSAK